MAPVSFAKAQGGNKSEFQRDVWVFPKPSFSLISTNTTRQIQYLLSWRMHIISFLGNLILEATFPIGLVYRPVLVIASSGAEGSMETPILSTKGQLSS